MDRNPMRKDQITLLIPFLSYPSEIIVDSPSSLLISKLPPEKRVALFLPGQVKHRKHGSANVSFCDPVRRTGFSKQTIKNLKFNFYKRPYLPFRNKLKQ